VKKGIIAVQMEYVFQPSNANKKSKAAQGQMQLTQLPMFQASRVIVVRVCSVMRTMYVQIKQAVAYPAPNVAGAAQLQPLLNILVPVVRDIAAQTIRV
jgi:hypothetical protein